MNDNLQPLELHVKQLLESQHHELPDRTVKYWERYTHLVESLREHVYPYVNAGLACLSKSPGIYTDHGERHFDEVVRYAGLLLAHPENKEPHGLTPYELYLLLCAIRLHDAGNIDGREEHDRRALNILEQYGGNIVHDAAEFELIYKIAEAHGGYDSMTGDKDTIIALSPDDTPVGGITCRPRHVAAMVRFADEVCEHRGRASVHHILSKTLPEENKLFHYYAASISGAVPDRKAKSFRLNLAIDTQYLLEKFPTPKKDDSTQSAMFLIDEVRSRLTKLDRERIYCNQFLDPRLQTDQIEVQIRLIQSKTIGSSPQRGEVERFELRIPPPQTGYPATSSDWQSKHEELTGEKIAARANKGWK